MSESYLYKFVHPEKGIIYIGQAKNKECLDGRIKSHLYSAGDNIDKRYIADINSSDIYCMPLINYNPAELNIVESILINKYKPLCNKANKCDGVHINYEVDEKWEAFEFTKKNKITPASKVTQRNKPKLKDKMASELNNVLGKNAKAIYETCSNFILDKTIDAITSYHRCSYVQIRLSELCDVINIKYDDESNKVNALLEAIFNLKFIPTQEQQKVLEDNRPAKYGQHIYSSFTVHEKKDIIILHVRDDVCKCFYSRDNNIIYCKFDEE